MCAHGKKLPPVFCTPVVINSWFKTLKEVLTLHKLFDRPNAIFNVGECSFFGNPDQHPGATVLICTSASGKLLSPYIILEGKPVGSPGRLEEPLFFDWLWNHFVPFICGVPRPVLLILNGHQAHISTRISHLALDEGIELLCLPPHSAAVLQPLNVVTFPQVKTAWRKILRKYNAWTHFEKIDEILFTCMIEKLWRQDVSPGHCSAGFARAGIYPFDPRAIPKKELFGLPSKARMTRSSSCMAFSIDSLTAGEAQSGKKRKATTTDQSTEPGAKRGNIKTDYGFGRVI